MTNNPLSKYFRVPKLNTTVPSRFRIYDDSVVDHIDEEVSVMPMTASDEMIFKNPDNLLNGTAVIAVIKSCIPQIKKPEKISTNDMDSLIVAIRVATYGEILKLTSSCPKCSKSNTYDINMNDIISNMTFLEDDYSITTKDNIKITLSPISYEESIEVIKLQFDQAKIARTISDDNLSDDDRRKILSSIFEKMAGVNASVIFNSVSKVEVLSEDIVVTNREHINEFMKNTDATTVGIISNKLEKISEVGVPKKVNVKCEGCGHEWMSELDYNPVDFFTKS
jgi:hypothetical protein